MLTPAHGERHEERLLFDLFMGSPLPFTAFAFNPPSVSFADSTFGVPLACLPRTAGGKLYALEEGALIFAKHEILAEDLPL